jgi:threonine-phosphate decarboxylase
VPWDYLICGNGAAEVIYAYCEAVGARAPWAAAPETLRAAELAPTFAEYSLAFLRSQADYNPTSGNVQNAYFEKDTRKIIRYPLKKENGFAPDAGLLSFIEKEQPHVLFLCHPNNPTGIPFEEGLLREIIALCGKLSIRIFLDECFLDLTSGIWDAKEMLAENPHLFILKAFTKSYGMAGVRLGFGMTADTALLGKMSQAVQPWNVSTPAQAAGIAALQEKEFLQKTVALIEKERPYLKSELEKMGYYTTDSVTNYILFEAEKDLAKELRKQGIAIRKCENYHGLDAGWYRIAVRTHEENEKLISAIRKVRGK